jgi:hypothetical protein
MQTYPAGIQSGMDYYFNDAGLLVAETTIAQTHFNREGKSVASRIRQALQYADTIDRATEILSAANNGLYTNEWLLGDVKTNEIAMFELGTAKSKLYRSSKNEWFGGTEGFYWGCNNTKDRAVRLETIPGVKARPGNMCFCPSDRDKKWLQLYEKHKGKIDADFGKEAFTTPPLAAYPSLDAKFTTTDLARQLKTWALFGPPLGSTWEPSPEERKRFPEIRPLVSHPWTILQPSAPPREELAAVDVPESLNNPAKGTLAEQEQTPVSKPAWHGTLLPKTDADTWLAVGFAAYERIVAAENALRERRESGDKKSADSSVEDREKLAADLFVYRTHYQEGCSGAEDVPLGKTHSDVRRSDWYNVAAGKGVWLLHELRQLLGDETFTEIMDSFGREHAGKEVTSAQFQAHAEQAAHKPLGEFFSYWLEQPGLPNLRLGNVQMDHHGSKYTVQGEVLRITGGAPLNVQIALETAKGEILKNVRLESPKAEFSFETSELPRRVIVDKYGLTAKANSGGFSVLSFYTDLEHTLIVYGTANEISTNRESAEALQRGIIRRQANYRVPIKTDNEVTEDDLKSHHVLLVGRPDTNYCVARFQGALPVSFGHRSFTVRNESYAHAGSALIAAAANPLNSRLSIVVLAGLSTESTLDSPAALLGRMRSAAEVLVLANNAKPRALVVPARELIRDIQTNGNLTGGKVTSPTGGRSGGKP